MEVRYKSLAAMEAGPWIEHFKKTAGDTSILTTRPRPVVIKRSRNSENTGRLINDSLPLTIVSPVGLSNEMAAADLNMEMDKRTAGGSTASVGGSNRSGVQRARKRKQSHPASASNTDRKKKIAKIKDIFSGHGDR